MREWLVALLSLGVILDQRRLSLYQNITRMSSVKGSTVPATYVTSLRRHNFEQHIEDTMHAIERFVILLYDRTIKCKDVNKARNKLFAKKSSVQNIPPTYAALEQHVRRSALQGGHVWGQALVPEPVLPPPTDWGWHRCDDGPYTPLWTTLPEASKTCYELVSCGCKKGCRNRCKCKSVFL